MNLIGEKVILRALEEEDMEYLRNLVNDPVLESQVVGKSFPVSKLMQKEWYKLQNESTTNLKLAVEYNGTIIGQVSLEGIDWKNRSAYHGIKLGKESQGKKLGYDVLNTIMRYAFDELQLNRIETGILETNERSIRFYLNSGWKKEGVLREYIYKNGRYLDCLSVAILKRDYDEYKNSKL